MEFQEPMMITVGAFVCLALIFIFRRFEKMRSGVLAQFASNRLLQQLTENISDTKRLWKKIFFIAGIALLFVALARPQYGFRWQEVKRKGIDILIALDTSKSMLASDVKPNRLARAKFGIADFVSKVGGDRVGLMPFAGGTHLMCPMTMDYAAFMDSLDSIDTNIIPQGGTDIAHVIRQSQKVFQNDANFKILILVTDGEDLEGEVVKAAENAAKKGVTIYTVGVGSSAGELIPIADGRGGFSYLKDSKGEFVKSRLDETMLREISQITKGMYQPLGSRGEGLERIYKSKLNLVPKEEIAERMSKIPLERFEWSLLIGILFLIIEFLMGDRKAVKEKIHDVKTAGRRDSKRNKAAKVLAFFIAFMVGANSFASVKSAEEKYEKADYAGAMEEYKKLLDEKPGNQKLKYNYAISAYKSKIYEESRKIFDGFVFTEKTDLNFQQKVYYGLANSAFFQGIEKIKSKPNDAVKDWKEALKSYKGVMRLKEEKNEESVELHDLAKAKYDIVEDKLKRLKEELKKMPKQEGGEQGEGEDQDGDDDSEGSEGESQQQNGESDQQQEGQENQEQSGEQENQDPQQEQADQENEQNEEQQGAEESEEEEKPEGEIAAANEQEEQKDDEEAVQRVAGEMSKEEAEKLLDSLKDGKPQGHFLFEKNEPRKDDNKIRRDW